MDKSILVTYIRKNNHPINKDVDNFQSIYFNFTSLDNLVLLFFIITSLLNKVRFAIA